jgi:hypothetical protein
MKKLIKTSLAILGLSLCAGTFLATAADQKAETRIKPYILKTCIVSGDKLGEMGSPFVYTNQDRQIKFCCKGCLKDFNKSPEKFMKKIEEAEKALSAGKAAAETNAPAHHH